MILYWVCGIESILKKPSEEELMVYQTASKVDTSIDQDRFWNNFCDINAVIALALTGFVIAFLNKY